MFDIVFAGGGTTACVIAGRLAAANPSLKILVVENGQHSRDVSDELHSFGPSQNPTSSSAALSSYVSKPNAHLNGRSLAVSCPNIVGGGSAIDHMFYVRGAASDYNDWEAFGNKGWSFDELLPLIKKFETFSAMPDRPTHGYSGPIKISRGKSSSVVGTEFLNVAKAYDPTRSQVDDCNDFKTSDAYGPIYKYADSATGKRSDAASRYLYPQTTNTNLQILVGKHVKRVIIENGRAVGIEYTTNGCSGEPVIVKASKLVVISAGTFGSTSILERSGIGAPSILEKNKIHEMVALPGVGENYQDHLGVCIAFHAPAGIEAKKNTSEVGELEEDQTRRTALSEPLTMLKVRLTAAELKSAGPALRSRWETFFRHYPDKSMGMILSFDGFPLGPPALPGRNYLCAIYFLVRNVCYIIPHPLIEFDSSEFAAKMYPNSTGSAHVTPCEDPSSPLDFDPDFLSKADDLEQLRILYKMTRERFRRMPSYRGEVVDYHPRFSPHSAAACRETDGPVPIDAPDIVYSDADDRAIDDFHCSAVISTMHSLGTCAMKPRDQGGVVDARLNVYGVEGLKVADLSICPSNVGNNTDSTAYLIGEKAAVIIAEDLGLKL